MTIRFFPPTTDRYDAMIDEAIATCNGDLSGAMHALVLANEFLEKELEKARLCNSNEASFLGSN